MRPFSQSVCALADFESSQAIRSTTSNVNFEPSLIASPSFPASSPARPPPSFLSSLARLPTSKAAPSSTTRFPALHLPTVRSFLSPIGATNLTIGHRRSSCTFLGPLARPLPFFPS